MMKRDFGTWADYHRTAMQVIGREVEMVGVPVQTLCALGVPNLGTCESIFAYNTIYSPARLMRDVPEFRPRLSLEEGLTTVLEAMDRKGIPDSDASDWEDRLIAAQRQVGEIDLGV
jgi:hypothetical protein